MIIRVQKLKMKKSKDNQDVSAPSPLERAGVRIKICGMKFPENILEVGSLLPDFMGFIFWEKSSRYFDGEMPMLPKKIKNAPKSSLTVRPNREIQHVNKSPGFTLVVGLEVAFLFITKFFAQLLKQPTNTYTYMCLSPHCRDTSSTYSLHNQ